MSGTTPIDAPAAFDIFKLDRLLSPFTRITECNGRELTWQEQQAPGFVGAFVVFRGEKLLSVTYGVELIDRPGFARLAPLVEIIASSLDRLEAAIDSLHETTEIHMHNQRRAVMRARQLLWDNDDDWPAPDKDWPVPAPTPPFNSEGLPYPLDENGYYDSAPDDELPCISCGH